MGRWRSGWWHVRWPWAELRWWGAFRRRRLRWWPGWIHVRSAKTMAVVSVGSVGGKRYIGANYRVDQHGSATGVVGP